MRVISTIISTTIMASQGSSDSRFVKSSVIRGHHVYKAIWTPALREELIVKAEDGNVYDEHTMAVVKEGNVVGHMPRSISRVSWFFLKRGGRILCRVTGKRKLGVALEVPCKYIYIGSTRTVQKLKKIMDNEMSNELSLSCPS